MDNNEAQKISKELGEVDVRGKYSKVIFENSEYGRWDLVRFSTPSDGNCLFHAIANSYFECYHKEKIGNQEISKRKIIKLLRKGLAGKLEEKTESGETRYEQLGGGNIKDFSKYVHEFELSTMKKNLGRLGVFIGYGYIEHISNVLNKDIYIVEEKRQDIYISDDLKYTIKGNRPSIILYYFNYGHYELIGLKEKGKISTHFSPSHSFIKFLYQKVQQKIIS